LTPFYRPLFTRTTTATPYYDADGNGAGAAIEFATLGTTTLVVTDFMIV
jgi:hypothetical protein